MPDLAAIIERLNRARAGLLSAANRVPPFLWQRRPQPKSWSPAEVIAHVTMVESAILEGVGRLLRNAPRPVPVWRRVHLPVWLVEWRGVRRETPLPLDPSFLGGKEAMLARLGSLRERTLGFLESQRNRDLRAYRWPHPFLGSLNFYQWFRVMAHHEVRHTKQIRETVEFFQN